MSAQMQPFASFDIATHKFWVPFYRQCETVETLLWRIECVREQLKHNEGSETLAGALLCLRFVYTADVCRCEGIADLKIDAIEALVATNSGNLSVAERDLSVAERAGYNVFYALAFVLDEQREFSVNNIKELHARVGAGIIDGAGRFRTTLAAPIGSYRMYKHPRAVATALEDLIQRVNSAMPFTDDRRAIVVASAFLAEFLAIHPFSDGNGRVARLCLSWILKDRFLVPITLAEGGWTESRETFLQCLEMPECWNGAPSQLARFVLECAVDTATSVAFCADIQWRKT